MSFGLGTTFWSGLVLTRVLGSRFDVVYEPGEVLMLVLGLVPVLGSGMCSCIRGFPLPCSVVAPTAHEAQQDLGAQPDQFEAQVAP